MLGDYKSARSASLSGRLAVGAECCAVDWCQAVDDEPVDVERDSRWLCVRDNL
jgi:hypothetical protein